VQGFTLGNANLKFFSNVWPGQKMTSLELAHRPVISSKVEKFFGDLKKNNTDKFQPKEDIFWLRVLKSSFVFDFRTIP
jgi:hypothetical protein